MEGRLSLSLRVVLSCHGMLCWLPAGPGGCSVAGRDQTGTQSLFPVSLFPPLPHFLVCFSTATRFGHIQKLARRYSRLVFLCVVILTFAEPPHPIEIPALPLYLAY
jgi:hypothetical protein